ncbi:porin [Burkholderia multivorans]|uniref:porin n=1 Tax=Burkholderia multivorans TaxID=87883 RepID=UPI002018E5BE|nr:porin [Burkholderia multivorans]MCO1368643.1 porin [Burkholderia multivorans]MCO1380534.1 porin [Burkholderia multivorans]MDN8032401.1 porin [Burkholderia multivorans]UQP22039.1 porin [Burkholderia multivorans]UQP91513.1 porin [Burkholderia multivorans]
MLNKKSLLVTSVIAAAVASPDFAQAQSSVQMYGRIDAGLEYVSGQPTGPNANGAPTGTAGRFSQESGDGGVSMFGLKGTEDIGGGTKILFHLELQFLANNGTLAGTGLFNRFSTVGISNDSYGTLTLGHQLFISNAVWDFDPFGQSPWASASLVRGRNWPFTDNAVNYDSPKFGGFDFTAQYALSNATSWNGNGATTSGRNAGFYGTYTSSVFQVRALYDETRNPTTGKLDDPFLYSREYTLATNVFLGQVKLTAAYQASRTSGVASSPGQPTTTDHFWGGATWQATPAFSLTGAAYHINANNNGGNATMYSVGAAYSLSKRTVLSTQFATVRNSSTANFSLFAINPAGDSVATGNPPKGHTQSGAYIGMMHYF